MYKGKFKLEGPEGQKVNEAASAVSRRLADALELTPDQLRVRAALAQSCVHGYAALGLIARWNSCWLRCACFGRPSRAAKVPLGKFEGREFRVASDRTSGPRPVRK